MIMFLKFLSERSRPTPEQLAEDEMEYAARMSRNG